MRLTMKPGVERACTGVLPQRWLELEDRLRHRRVGLEARDHLHQLHQRHRVEEVHADEAARRLQAVGERGDRDRGGVRGEDAARVDLGLELAEQGPLGFGVLDDRLDHQADAGGFVEPVDRADAGDRGLRLLGVELALGDQALERLLELGAGRGGGAFAGVEQAHRVPGLGRDLGDARAHDAGADDEHRRAGCEIDVHPASLGPAAPLPCTAGAVVTTLPGWQASGAATCAI